jgi:hypothetical protein
MLCFGHPLKIPFWRTKADYPGKCRTLSIACRPYRTGINSYTASVPSVGSSIRDLLDSLACREGTRKSVR